jgi:molybdopterin/thiamine biosynthesis adenylyltransferase
VKVSVHTGELTEDLVSKADVLVMTTTSRSELIRWNTYCRSFSTQSFDLRGRTIEKPAPIRFIAVNALGALAYIFSDFGSDFTVADKNGEPPVQRVITHISNDKEGIVTLLDPNDSELAKKADISDNDHEGFITFSEVEGMYCKEEGNIKTLGHSLNTSGPWRAREVWKRIPDYLLVDKNRGGDGKMMSTQYYVHVVDKKTGEYKKDADRPDGLYWEAKFVHECSNIPEKDFVLDEEGNKMQRMTVVKEHYKLQIGDTTGFSKHQGGGILQQVYQPVTLHHRSLASCLQQPLDPDEKSLFSSDGEKEKLGWWYSLLHVIKQGIFQFESVHGRLPTPNNASEAEEVIEYCKVYNRAMKAMESFCGKQSVLACSLDLDLAPIPPPSKEAIESDAEKKDLLEQLVGMCGDEVKALLALNECGWNGDDAMMVLFDDDKMNQLQAGINTFKALNAMKKLILTCGTELQPVCVFIGGACAQEVVKHCGKFTPINQWIHFDFIEVLPEERPSAELTAPRGSRYDHNIAIFGADVQDRLLNIKTFMVGCGALGCELLKNFALMGIACGPNGLITVTDGDRIEVSNLNRQFLFRKQHVKKPKSLTAAEAVRQMNPDINVEALELLAMEETEKIFNDNFWIGSGRANRSDEQHPGIPVRNDNPEGLHFVVNALDNVKARKYVDSRCVFYKKPLLESGTEGTKFNTMVIIPHKTVSYDEGEADAPEGEAIPMCTLRNFPSTIIHCIEWARGLFEDLFVSPLGDLKEYLANPSGYVHELREQAEAYMLDQNDISRAMDKLCDSEGNGLLRSVRAARAVRDGGYAACVRLAHEIFITKFNHAMKDLQHQFPKDLMSNGKPFWSPPKRFPTIMETDLNDEYVVTFLISVANLIAVAYGLNPLPVNGIDEHGNDFDTFIPLNSSWRDTVALAAALPAEEPIWRPTTKKIDSGEKTEEGEEENKAPTTTATSLQDSINELLSRLDALSAVHTDGLVAQPADFEKDLDLNFHIDFIAAASNLRASNYEIPRATRHKTKMIAGKIIAAIATSTACATALVGVELLKLVQQKPVSDHRDSTCNFAVNQFQMSEPSPANVIKGSGEKRPTPDPLNQPELYDDNGEVDWEKVPVHKWKAYPDPHTKWDDIHLSASLTLQQTIEFFKSQHNLKLLSWLVTLKDDNGKTTGKQIYSEPPVDTSIDEELLLQVAPLSLTNQKAQMAVMKCGDMKNKQAYSQRWQLLKLTQGDEYQQKMNTTLQQLLESHVGSLSTKGSVVLEMQFEIANEPSVEAVTPAILMDM